jgi:2-polyprenyl-3-methyl-5-hydroxy-6-metoxy-1,4-benzoquinol methylase
MNNYWNQRFIKERHIWGTEPSNVAVKCKTIFDENDVRDILVMGIGYGRNGRYFVENNFNVDGIEYSEEAINIGKMYCPKINFINGSVLTAKLNKKYDAIFCYSILHLFQANDRKILIENCIRHCNENGIIIISCCSTKDKAFGIGKKIEENTYEIKPGKIMHFFTEDEIINMSYNLKNIKFDYSYERIKSDERNEEYNMIYGIYRVKTDKTCDASCKNKP